jgi:hypothetical protein
MIIKISSVNGTRANSNEKHTILAVLGAKFCHRCIQASFADRIRGLPVNVIFGRPAIICQASRYCEDFLSLDLEDEWHEEVEEMNISNNIRFEGVE